jgi:hypothetical protein
MRWTPLLSLLLLTSCLDSVVVEGDGFVIDTEPRLEPRELVDPGAAFVISEDGAQVLADNIDPLARALLDLPEQGPLDLSGLVGDILADNPRILGNFTLSDVELTVAFPQERGIRVEVLSNPSRLRIEIAEMWVDIEATGTQPNRPGSFACRVRGKLDQGTANERMLTLRNVEVEVEFGAVGGRFDIGVRNLNFEIAESGIDVVTDQADPNYFCNFPECSDGLGDGCTECRAICGGAGILEDVGNFLAQFLDGILGNLVEILADRLVTVFEQLGGEVHPARFLGSYAPDLADSHRLEFGARPASGGIEVVGGAGNPAIAAQLALGFRAKDAHPCIGPDVKIPEFSAGAPPPSAGEGGHLSLGVPAALLNQLVWSAYRAGSLCLQISSDDLSRVSALAGGDLRITAGTLSLLLPGLDQVVGRDTPLLISLGPYLDPDNPEVIVLGSGLPQGEDDGAPLDSLLKLQLPPLELGIHAWVEGRWLRLFGLQAKVRADVTPTLRVDGGIDITIDEVDVDSVTETYNELFGGVQLEQLFSAAFDLALGLLAGGGIELPIDLQTLLTTALGVPLEVELTGLRTAGGGGDWLLVTADLAGTEREAAVRPAITRAQSLSSISQGTSIPVRAWAVGLAGERLEGADVQYRINGGAWRGWQPAGDVVVESALFLIPGLHAIELRSRTHGDWRSVDLTPETVLVEVVEEQLALEATEPAEAAGGCGVARGTGSVWPVAILGFFALLLWRRRAPAFLVAVVALAGCGDSKPGAQVVNCASSQDCPAGQVCGCAGVCYGPQVCDSDVDCCAGTTCVEGACSETRECEDSGACDGGEFCSACLCRLPRCESDGDCDADSNCVAGACTPGGSFPCPMSCAEDEVCVGELRRCTPRPPNCAADECAPGEALVVDRADDVLGPICSLDEAECHCETLTVPVVSGDPTGYLGVVHLADGDLLVGAYDLGLQDVTVRRVDVRTREPGPVTWLEGFPEVDGPLQGEERGAFGPGLDIGSELDMAQAVDGTIGLAYRDLSTGTLRVRFGDGEQWNEPFDLDDGGRSPDIEADRDGGWVIAYQQVVPAGSDELTFDTALRVAATTLSRPLVAGDFDLVTIAEAQATLIYPELPSGQGATPSLGAAEGRWYVVWHDGISGALALATWTQLPRFETDTVVLPETRGDYSGGVTGVAPRLVARPPDNLDALFLDATSGELRHARWRWTGAVSELVVQTVDAGNNDTPQREIGRDYSLVSSPDGRLLAAWQDATFGDLWLGRASGQPAQWDAWAWSTEGATGFFPRIVYTDPDSPPLLVYGRWTFPEVRTIHQELVVQTFQDRR